METIGSLGEFGLIEIIRRRFNAPEGVVGIGDDCAVIPHGEDDILVTADLLVEKVHFLREDVSPWRLGWKSAAVNLSDVAAMGGRPMGTFLSLALPPDITTEWAEEFISGYETISKRFNAPLLGGDTTSSKGDIAINVAVLGLIGHGRAKLRSQARIGDAICVTGPLGDSGAGLKVILSGVARGDDENYLVGRHYCPMPRVDEGTLLAELSGVHAMMDISDGVASDLNHILTASGVGAEVEVTKLPISRQMRSCAELHGWDPVKLALSAGEDYELLFTCDESALDLIRMPFYRIGTIVEGSGLSYLSEGEKRSLEISGFTHF